MYTYKFGGQSGSEMQLDIANDMVVVRTKDEKPIDEAIQSPTGKNVLTQLSRVAQFPEAGVSVLRCRQARNRLTQLRDQARQVFQGEADVRFAGRVLRDTATGTPVVYTENFFVKFRDGQSPAACQAILQRYNLEVKRQLNYATNAYFVGAPEGTGLNIFRIAQELLDEEAVELCHPELIREAARRAIAPQQWHLQQTMLNGSRIDAHVNVEGAWQVTRGQGITIAVIDDGVDTDHEEFNAAGKIVHPRDATLRTSDARPKDRFFSENHGTACAGVACATGQHQASGVAPDAHLMPIRLVSSLGSQAEADAFEWAADHGADVISCSWGPPDGEWWNPSDARHNQIFPLPDSTRLAIDYATHQGRNGKGCVIVWAAGNGNESVDNDGYANYDKVVAVAACNDRNSHSVYSDFGSAVWCTFPSSDFGHAPFNHPMPQTPGIWTTDRQGRAGYNPGVLNPGASNPPGDDHGHYTESFGGTSSACPGVAGLAALILAANPDLHWHEVKDILRQSATRVDEVGGSYDNQGHSPLYGYGRPDAAQAVQLALGTPSVGHPQLTLGASVQGRLEATGAARIYAVNLPTAATVAVDGPGGVDFDLYIKRDAPPTTSDYDLRAYTSSADETLTVQPPSPGTYYIMVRSYQGSGDFTLDVTLQA